MIIYVNTILIFIGIPKRFDWPHFPTIC